MFDKGWLLVSMIRHFSQTEHTTLMGYITTRCSVYHFYVSSHEPCDWVSQKIGTLVHSTSSTEMINVQSKLWAVVLPTCKNCLHLVLEPAVRYSTQPFPQVTMVVTHKDGAKGKLRLPPNSARSHWVLLTGRHEMGMSNCCWCSRKYFSRNFFTIAVVFWSY